MKKTKIVKLPKPKKGDSSQYTAVLLENVQDQFRAFGESLDFVRDDVAVLKDDVTVIKDDIVVIKTDVSELKTDVAEIKFRLRKIELEIIDIKTEIKSLRLVFDKKADLEKMNQLEQRVIRLEREVASLLQV